MQTTIRKLAAEAFGTFALVFAGTGAIVVNEVSAGTVSHVGIALTFGLIVLAMIVAIGGVSGCHINPAVTLGLCAARRFDERLVAAYVIAQCAGGLLASGILRLLFPASVTLGATEPSGGIMQSFVMEFLLTLILMFVILCAATAGREQRQFAGVAIGAVVALEALFAGPVSNASMNPARSLAPAVVSLRVESLWIYLVAPVLGAVAGVAAWRCVRDPDRREDATDGGPA